MRRMYDFECLNCGALFEDLVEPGTDDPTCTRCGSVDAKRLISATRIDPRMGIDPSGFPTMGDKWAKTRAQKQKIERKRDLENR